MLLFFWRIYWHWNDVAFLSKYWHWNVIDCFGENTGTEMLLRFWRKYWHWNVVRPTFGFPPIKFTSSRSLVRLILLRSRVSKDLYNQQLLNFFFCDNISHEICKCSEWVWFVHTSQKNLTTVHKSSDFWWQMQNNWWISNSRNSFFSCPEQLNSWPWVRVLLLLTYKERAQRLVTFETSYQRDEETWPDQTRPTYLPP